MPEREQFQDRKENMNNYEKIKECETLSDLALFLGRSDLGEILQIEEPIPDRDFYEYWLKKKCED